MSALKMRKKKRVTLTFYIYYQFYLFFIYLFFFMFTIFFSFFMVTKQIFIFIFSIFFFTFLVNKQYTSQLYVIHWNPPVKDSQSQVNHGLNTNAVPTLHAWTRKGLPLPLARKLQRKLVTTKIQIFFFFFFFLRKTEIQI